MKKLISIIISAAMLSCAFYAHADLADEYTYISSMLQFHGEHTEVYYFDDAHSEWFIYRINEKGCLEVYKRCGGDAFTVPAEINGIKVKYVAITDYAGIKTLILPDEAVGFECFNDQGSSDHMKLSKRDKNSIEYLHLGRDFSLQLCLARPYDIEYPFYRLESLKKIFISEDNPWFSSKDGIAYSKDFTKLIRCPEQIELENENGSYTLPDATVEIGDNAFTMTNIKRLRATKNLTTIGINAFKYSKLRQLKSAENLSEIKSGAFSFSKLESFWVGKSIDNICGSVFNCCKNLKKVVLRGEKLTKIYSRAFDNCKKLSRVYLRYAKQPPKIKINAFRNTKPGIKFFTKNRKAAKRLKRNLKSARSRAVNAKIYAGKKCVCKM